MQLPIAPQQKLTPTLGDPLPNPLPYQRLIGKLLYLTITRPNISYTVHILSIFMQHPTTTHFQANKRVLRYFLSSRQQGILLASHSVVVLTAYCDNDWARCPMLHKSTTGFCVLGSSPISWKSKKQRLRHVVLLKMNIVLWPLTTCEISWLQQLSKDLGLKHLAPVMLQCDHEVTLSIIV